MEQKSNVQNRADKEYKNSREKFHLLLREILSNSIQAVLIRKEKEKARNGNGYMPKLSLIMTNHEKNCSIELRDNGEGFTEINSQCFNELDRKNEEKVRYKFHPLDQGRLAIVFFSDGAMYETVLRGSDGGLKKKSFPYPMDEGGLFDMNSYSEDATDETDTYTNLKIVISKQNTLSRAKTFFKKYGTAKEVKRWFIETFFPVISSNDDLTISIELNGETETLTRSSIEAETKKIPFKVAIEDDKEKEFVLWLIKKGAPMRGENEVSCFARNLSAELENGKLRYVLDSQDGYLLYLSSEYFDDCVDNKGEKIEISSDAVSSINEELTKKLDEFFQSTIEANQKQTKRNLRSFKSKYPSLDAFIPDNTVGDNKGVLSEDDLVRTAIDTKGKYEKKFWTKMSKPINEDEEIPYDESEECEKLLNSSLHIYVKHRERVLERLYEMIKPYDEEGNQRDELESDVQELLFRRGTTLESGEHINHLHNLWILDDKFTTFSDTRKAKSTKPGQAQSDIYIWTNDPKSVKQVLIIELKSTTHAHNAGDKEEGMIAQVKRYAQNVYNNPQKVLNWNDDASKFQYQGIILARKKDIKKELISNNVSGYRRIPFLKDSYYNDDEFNYSGEPDDRKAIRIELYSFEDIYQLASDRNDVFFRLLKNELGVNTEDEEDV